MATAASLHTVEPVDSPPERIVLYDVSWDGYETLLEEIGDRNVRLTYDEGTLEIMTLSMRHESWKKLIAALIEILSLEMNMPMRRTGSVTSKRKDLAKGLEPDECYYIQHERQMRGKTELDLTRDPPPDLAVEVEVSYRVVNRGRIYAALGVPELWRFDGQHLTALKLVGGDYEPTQNSLAFPFLCVQDLDAFLKPDPTTDETSLLLAFRDWVRASFVQPGPGQG